MRSYFYANFKLYIIKIALPSNLIPKIEKSLDQNITFSWYLKYTFTIL